MEGGREGEDGRAGGWQGGREAPRQGCGVSGRQRGRKVAREGGAGGRRRDGWAEGGRKEHNLS